MSSPNRKLETLYVDGIRERVKPWVVYRHQEFDSFHGFEARELCLAVVSSEGDMYCYVVQNTMDARDTFERWVAKELPYGSGPTVSYFEKEN